MKKSSSSADSLRLKLIESTEDKLQSQLQRPALADGDLGKVQELLFGQQLNTTTRQIEELKAYFDEKMTETSLQFMSHISQLGDLCDSRFQATAKDFNEKNSYSRSEIVRVEDELNSAQTRLDAKLTSESDRVTQISEAYREELESAREYWAEALDSTQQQLVQQLKQTADALQKGKVDRSDLSSLLASLASQLTQIDDSKGSESAETSDAAGNC